jgi:hypothetical protein
MLMHGLSRIVCFCFGRENHGQFADGAIKHAVMGLVTHGPHPQSTFDGQELRFPPTYASVTNRVK